MRKAIIIGAAGRDFHNFNVFFRDNPEVKVVAFTATQIPFIENRLYPASLAGKNYPDGIPIYPERMLPELIKKFEVDDVYFSYSDVSFSTRLALFITMASAILTHASPGKEPFTLFSRIGSTTVIIKSGL